MTLPYPVRVIRLNAWASTGPGRQRLFPALNRSLGSARHPCNTGLKWLMFRLRHSYSFWRMLPEQVRPKQPLRLHIGC